MFIIVGLGNPGSKYENTRHNMGYKVIDAISKDTGIRLGKEKFKSIIGEGFYKGEKLILVKPETYMNNSGVAVREIMSYFDLEFSNLIVIYDDIDLPIGSIRIRKAGGPGTHNGMRSIVKETDTNTFPRLRIGIGNNNKNLINHVIGKVPKDEQNILAEAVTKAKDSVLSIVDVGIDNAMNYYNRREHND